MTTWLQTPQGEDVYVVTLTHADLSLVCQALLAEARATALSGRYERLTVLADQFDPAKVRGDALRAHGGPLIMGKEATDAR